MADNYLEKKFEEHLNAPYKPVKPRHAPTKERRAVVVFGAEGIGAAVVKSLRVAGHKVAFCDTKEEAGKETALRTGSDFFCADPHNADELVGFLSSVASKWGGVDIIVIVFPSPTLVSLVDATSESLCSYGGTFLRPLITCAQFMARERRDGNLPDGKSAMSQYGRLVGICPPLLEGSGAPASPMLTLTNSVLVALAKSLSAEMSPFATTVNCITPRVNGDLEVVGETECGEQQTQCSQLGRPEDVAKVVRFLIDEASDCINAENIVVGTGVTRK